ncbi:MAG TPA: L,D-transpeptidase [Ktedonobacteraceae bacterium]|jgi:lipoprotein-anchoring transpeptidase ErfK/SrfK
MKKTLRTNCYLGLAILFLGLLFSLSSLGTRESASAHAIRANVSAHAIRANVSVHAIYRRRWRKVIVVNLSRQSLNAYQNGRLVFSTAVLTGQPALPTPLGTYHIFSKRSPVTFRSPFPRRSRFWYPPTHINYALEFRAGYYLHDSWWHTVYGAGTSAKHYDPVYGWQEGSHGCVSMPLSAAARLYRWAPLGTTVRIIR